MSLDIEFVKQYCDHPQGLEQVYEAALKASQDLEENYAFIETGTRSGGSALAIMQAIVDSGNTDRWLFTIDPYGMKPYKQADEVVDLDYGEEHYRRAMKALSDYAAQHELNHAHYRMKSTDWMHMFDQTEFWYDGNNLNKMDYGFAYLDGDHDSDTVGKEYHWLKKHTPHIAVVVDDAHYLNDNVLKLGRVDQDRLFINTKVEDDE